MCPVSVNLAESMDVSTDSFLMDVAVGAAVGMVTPIGHRSITLLRGPGGYRFLYYFVLMFITKLLISFSAILFIHWIWPL